jgi:hypothetical protein
VVVTWATVSVANTYKVRRSTTSGSGYGIIASSVTTSQYVNNSGLVNGTTYYYVVSSVNACGESANSAQVSGTPGAGPVTLNPVADAFVRDGSTNGTNYGTATTLEVKNTATSGNNRNTYLRFTISSLPGSITSAKVRVYGAAATSAKACSIYAVASTSWIESGTGSITWSNAPAAGAKQGSSVTIGLTSQYYDFDVTAYLQAEKTLGHSAVSFMLKNDVQTGETQTTFNSKEAASNKPLLLVQ